MWCIQRGEYYIKGEKHVSKDINMASRPTRGTGGCTSPVTTKRKTLMNTLEDIMSKEEIINLQEYEKVDGDRKFQMFSQAIINVNNKFANVHQILNDPEDGINPRLEDDEQNVQVMLLENKQLRKELNIAKGLIAKKDLEIKLLRTKITKMTAKSMENNILIGDLIEETGEDPVELVKEFLNEKLLIEFDDSQVYKAHRLGESNHNSEMPRLMIVKVHHDLRDTILANRKNLRGKKNSQKRFYSVKKQLPDEWAEEKRELQATIRKATKHNDEKDEHMEKDKIEVKRRTLYINKVPQKKMLSPPKTVELFPEKNEQEKIDRMKFHSSGTKVEGGSTFTAHVLKTQSMTEVRRGYMKIKQMYPNAAHIMAAFSIKNSVEGYQDDREFGAAVRILDLMNFMKVNHLVVFVVRDYDGVHIGPRRHAAIQTVVKEAIGKILQK